VAHLVNLKVSDILVRFVMQRRRAGPRLLAGLRLYAVPKLPAGADEVTGVAVGIAFQIILVLRLGFPEGTGGRQFRHDLARPQTGGLDVRDRIFRDALLLLVGVENGRPVTHETGGER
jgi:hypothetical protein